MLSTDLIIKIKNLSLPATIILLYASNRTDKKIIYIKKLKEETTFTDKQIDEALKELAIVTIIDGFIRLTINPLIKSIVRDKDTLQISINNSLLEYLNNHNSSIKEFLNINKENRNTCLLFALLVENNKQLENNGFQLSFNALKDLLQVSGKYNELKDLQKNLISKPIRLINKRLNWEKDTYLYTYTKIDSNSKKLVGVRFYQASIDMEAIDL
jgi:hypothetical protein